MIDYTQRVAEVFNPLVAINADSFAIGTRNSAFVSLALYHRAWLFLNVGDMVATATLDVMLRQGTTAAGGGTKAIAGKAITQLTQAGGDGNQLLCIELKTEELDVDGGFEFVSIRDTVAAAAVEFSAVLFGTVPRFAPAPTTNWTEIVD